MSKAALATLIIIIAILSAKNVTLRNENITLKENVETLMKECDTMRTASGKAMAECGRLVLDKKQLAEEKAELAKDIRDVRVKLKMLSEASKTAKESTLDIVAEVHDTIIVKDTVETNAKTFRWNDAWTDVRGTVTDKEAEIRVESRDTLTTVVYREPKRWWFFRWGTKAIRQKVKSSNPHTKITYTEYIEIKR